MCMQIILNILKENIVNIYKIEDINNNEVIKLYKLLK